MIIYSYIEVLHEVSGVQKVLLDIHNGLKHHYQAKIASYLPYQEITKYFDIPISEYIQIKSISDLNHGIIFTHERKASTKCCLYNLLPWIDLKLIHIQHSVYDNLKWVSLYPKRIVSISDKVTNNLTDFFHIKPKRIYKIHNGIEDQYKDNDIRIPQKKFIKIAYVARIDENKRQIEIVNHLKGKLCQNIHIDFLGDGPLYKILCKTINNDTNFQALGYCSNINKVLPNYDYVMLFSQKEGLPITLIEGCMHGKPLIINDAGGNLEIGINKRNAFVVYTWEELLSSLNNLPNITDSEYLKLAQNSRLHYLKNFEYTIMIKKYIELIEVMIKHK